MLVEDDTNLLEIYGARLLAEGYEVVSAKDGEEALAMAVKEKPDLIISDIMMPKISGFDMLDILRSTPETKNAKVIMMTALNQAEDKERADKLGADRYLVKSQVTLEDVAQAAKEALGEAAPAANPPTPTETAPATDAPVTPVETEAPKTEAPATDAPILPEVLEATKSTPADKLPPTTPDKNAAGAVHTKVISPINDLNKQSDALKKLIEEEESKENMNGAPNTVITPQAAATETVSAPLTPPTTTAAEAPIVAPSAAPAPTPAPVTPTQIPVITPPTTTPTPQS